MNVPLPTHEEDRLASLYHYHILDTPAERCLAAGANNYMSKPVNLKDLIRLIESHLEPVKG